MSDRMKRTLVIETEVDRQTLNESERIVKNFFDKHSDKKMKVATPDFQEILKPIRDIEKEVARVTEKMPHMLGSIKMDQTFLADIKDAFSDIQVMFTDGSVAKGFDEIIEKAKTLSIRSVDLGDFVSTLRKSAQEAVDALDGIGAIQKSGSNKFLHVNKLDINGLKQAKVLVKDLVDIQQEMDDFNGSPLDKNDFYSAATTKKLLSDLQKITQELHIIESLGLNDDQLSERRRLRYSITGEAYDEDYFLEIKEDASQDKEVYDRALVHLKNYIKQTEGLIDEFKNNTNLFSNDEFSEYTKQLTRNLNTAKMQLQQIQQIGGQEVGHNISGDFSEVVNALNEIKSSLQIISDVFKNEDDAMRTMAENGVTSFSSLSEAIVSVYNNLSQLEELVDTISQKDFNITNITNPAPASVSKRHTVKQLKADIEEEMKHVQALFDDAYSLVDQLNKNKMRPEALQTIGMIGGIDEATGLPIPMRYENFQQEILEGMSSAKTKAKLENILVLIDGYITKLTEVNKLREKYGFGEWQDSFANDIQPVVQPKVSVEEQAVPAQQTETKTDISPVDGSETQQINNLKDAVDSVSKAIGRKNAGFIKEKEIVDATVDAEKKKLQELIETIINGIGGALDVIKDKFSQSFVVPDLDANKLQTSFDEIYNKFIELKDNIGTMQIDVGVNGKSITTAIQRALYAKEIEKGFEKVSFIDVFDWDPFAAFDDEEKFTNKLTGQVVNSEEQAREEFDEFFSDMWIDKTSHRDNDFLKTEQMIDRIVHRMNADDANQDNWAQVIVEAINAQGSNIVEAIKLILPKDAIDGVDESQLISAFKTLTSEISSWAQSHGSTPGDFFRQVKNGWLTPPSAVMDALRTLGMTSENGNPKFVMPDTGARNLGIAIGSNTVVSSQDPWNQPGSAELMKKIDEAVSLGAAIPRILDLSNNQLGFGRDVVFALQERAQGSNITNMDTNELNVDSGFLKATDEQIDKLLHTLDLLRKVGLHFDAIGDNILFDEKAGFSILDLSADPEPGVTTNDTDSILTRLKRKINTASGGTAKEKLEFLANLDRRAALPPEQRLVNSSTVASTPKKAENVQKPTEVKLTPTMDDGAVAKVVEENVAKTPATVKVTPVVERNDAQDDSDYDYEITFDYDDLDIVDTALDTQQSVDDESQSAADAAKAFVEAAKAKMQFVEANKKVAEGAQTSADAVKTEADSAKSAGSSIASIAANAKKDLAKIKTVEDATGNTLRTDETRTFKTDDAFVAETTTTKQTLLGEETFITTIQDFEKFAKEAKKSEAAVKKAQATLDEFLARFKSKTGGNAQFVEGFSDLEKTTVTADNIDDVFNSMRTLQEKYSELEANFRKGQSSLNPFVNAINNSEKIGNIFADVEHKYNGLTQKSQDLTNKFERLKYLFKEIAAFGKQMDVDKSAIDSDDFITFSKQVGEFNVLKAQIEGTIKAESRLQKEVDEQRKKSVQEYIELIKKRNEYELKAAREKDGSHMQSFYNAQVKKIQDQINQNDQQAILNQEEKNRLNAIELEQARQLDAIKERKASKAHEQAMFTAQGAEVQKRFDAGYLGASQFNNWQSELAKYQQYMDGIVQADDATIQKQKELLTQLYNKLIKMSNASKSFFSSAGTILPEDQWIDVQNVSNVSDELQKLYEQIAATQFDGMKVEFAGANEQLGKLNFTVDDGRGSFTQYTLSVDRATGATKLLQNVTKQALTPLQNVSNSLKKDFTGLFHALIGGQGAYAAIRYLRQGIQAVRELDLALTELKKVTDETEEVYDKFLETASRIGIEIGSTITQVTEATATFAKLGYSMDTATEMAKAALVYKNVGDGVANAEAAAESIISTMKGFGLEASNAMRIVDAFNEVGNNFSITSTGIGEALKVSASALSEGGNSLDESIALITAANEVVQNPNTVGTALKTLTLRLRGAKTELEEAGLDAENMAETTSSLQEKLLALTGGEVNIMADDNTFKNSTQILREMASVWEDMTDIQQADCCLYVQKCA